MVFIVQTTDYVGQWHTSAIKVTICLLTLQTSKNEIQWSSYIASHRVALCTLWKQKNKIQSKCNKNIKFISLAMTYVVIIIIIFSMTILPYDERPLTHEINAKKNNVLISHNKTHCFLPFMIKFTQRKDIWSVVIFIIK